MCVKTLVFNVMNGDTVLEHVLLLPGTHSQGWSMYLNSPFLYYEYLHFHI